MAIPKVLNLIPLASLASILFVVGYKLAKPSLFKEMYRRGRSQFVPFMVTILGIIFTDLLVGIGLGLAVAIVQILWNNYKIPYHFNMKDHKKGEPIHITLSEDVSFLNKASIMQTLNNIPDESHVVIDGSKTKTIHQDVLEIIADFRENAKTRGVSVETIELESDDGTDPVEQFGRVVLSKSNMSAKPRILANLFRH
jgi:MFS superfamily sulfate permease-like transporter